MSEDYTYPTTPTLADLRARVAELERENAELRAKVDAVPVAEIRAALYASVTPPGYRVQRNIVGEWLKVQP